MPGSSIDPTHPRAREHLADADLPARANLDNERRRVTVLAADVADAAALSARLDPDAMRRVVNHCLACVTDAVHRQEGTIAQYTGDAVLALFGAPLALEDGPRRAVQAALDAQHALRGVDGAPDTERGVRVQMRIGLHTGVVMVGGAGDHARTDYAAMGDATSVAAQLQQLAAPGAVLISNTTRQLIGEDFDTADLGELQVDHQRAPIHAFQVLRARSHRERRQALVEPGVGPHVGRQPELATLLELFEQAKRGRGHLVRIVGDTGMGKSRLLRELRRELGTRGADAWWLEGRCSPLGQTVPLLPCVEQLREQFEIEDSDGEEDIIAKIESGVERLGELDAHAPFLRALLAVEPGEDVVATMDASVRRARLFESLRALAVRASERRPVVLIFEDAQWVDPSTAAHLSAAVDAFARAAVLVVVTHRSGTVLPFNAQNDWTTVTLHSLSETDGLAIIRAVAGRDGMPEALSVALLKRTAGVPLFIEEAARTVIELGVPEWHDGGGAAAPHAGRDLPDTLEGAVLARLERLGDAARSIVHGASVIGDGFAKRTLGRIPELAPQLENGLAELTRRGLICEQGTPEPSYRFKHSVIREVAYDSVPPRQRKELHRAVGQAIEALYADRIAQHDAELVHHFTQAESWGKAIEYATRAGDRAARADAGAEAAAQYAAGLAAAERLQPPPPASATLHIKRAEVQNRLGRYDAGIADCERALELMQAHGDHRGEIDVLRQMAELHTGAHRSEAALQCHDEILALAGEWGDAPLEADCSARRAFCIAAARGPVAEARSAARAALEVTQSLEDAPLRCRTLIPLGTLLQWRADFYAALPYLHEGAQLAERLQTGYLRGQALFHLGHAYLSTGRYDQALRCYGEMHHYAESANDRYWLVRAPNVVGGVYLELYDLDAAIELCREGEEMAQQLSSSHGARAHCLVKIGLAELARGEHGSAQAVLERASALLEQDGWVRWRWQIPLLRARAELALAVGALDDAWRYGSESLDLAMQTDSRKHVAHAKLVLGAVAAAQDRLPAAEKLLRGAVTLADHIHAARELWLAGSALGLVLERLGRDRDAETYLIQAAQTIETIAGGIADSGLRASFTRAEAVTDVYRRLGRRPPP